MKYRIPSVGPAFGEVLKQHGLAPLKRQALSASAKR